MRTENLQEVIHAAPSLLFALCLADGTRVDVPHPDFIANPPEGLGPPSWSAKTSACISSM